MPEFMKQEQYYYVKGATIFHRPVHTDKGVRMGFAVCEVHDGVDPEEVCSLLNKAEPVEKT